MEKDYFNENIFFIIIFCEMLVIGFCWGVIRIYYFEIFMKEIRVIGRYLVGYGSLWRNNWWIYVVLYWIVDTVRLNLWAVEQILGKFYWIFLIGTFFSQFCLVFLAFLRTAKESAIKNIITIKNIKILDLLTIHSHSCHKTIIKKLPFVCD